MGALAERQRDRRTTQHGTTDRNPDPIAAVATSPEPVGTVAATCSGECRRSTQHAVERLRQPDGSVVVRRICTKCEAVEQITISKVVAERSLAENESDHERHRDGGASAAN